VTGGKGRKPEAGLSVELSIECADETVAAALNEALLPDNRYFPKDQQFRASKEGNTMRFDVWSPRVRPAINTVSSIISDAMLFRDVWVEAMTRGRGSHAR
jgi:hypothetical protein